MTLTPHHDTIDLIRQAQAQAHTHAHIYTHAHGYTIRTLTFMHMLHPEKEEKVCPASSASVCQDNIYLYTICRDADKLISIFSLFASLFVSFLFFSFSFLFVCVGYQLDFSSRSQTTCVILLTLTSLLALTVQAYSFFVSQAGIIELETALETTLKTEEERQVAEQQNSNYSLHG